jgi:hypothetical protein
VVILHLDVVRAVPAGENLLVLEHSGLLILTGLVVAAAEAVR